MAIGAGNPSGSYGSGGYTCPVCYKWVGMYEVHTCCSTPPVIPSPSGGIFVSPCTTTTSVPMMHILWQEYVPARPPSTSGDYLIVYLDGGGFKKCTRGSFSISTDYKHSWYNEAYALVTGTVTHYVKIDLPV